MKQLQLVDLVHVSTRVTANSSSQIDVLMTADGHCFDSTGVFLFSGSDHHLIVSHFYPRGICVDPPSHQFVVSRNFQRLDIDKLNEILTCDDIWDDVFSKFDNPSDRLECFNLIMSHLLYLLIPPRTIRTRRQSCPWLSSCAVATVPPKRNVALARASRFARDGVMAD